MLSYYFFLNLSPGVIYLFIWQSGNNRVDQMKPLIQVHYKPVGYAIFFHLLLRVKILAKTLLQYILSQRWGTMVPL